jgi:cytochrome c5
MRFGQLIPLIALSLSSRVGMTDDSAYPSFEGSPLVQGRTLWLENCEGCHGYGIAGAPIPMVPDEWRERLLKGQQALYQHALEGFYGPDDTLMPAHGGNDALTDDEVRRAVDYMTALANHYIHATENPQ